MPSLRITRPGLRVSFWIAAFDVFLLMTLPGVSVSDSDLVAYWSFDDTSNASVTADLTGNHPGFISGATFTTTGCAPVPGNVACLSFDGSGAHVEVPDAPALDLDTNDPMTIIVWFKLVQTRSVFHVYGKRDSCSGHNYQLAEDPTFKLHFANTFSGTNPAFGHKGGVVTAGELTPVGEWTFVGLRYIPTTSPNDGNGLRMLVRSESDSNFNTRVCPGTGCWDIGTSIYQMGAVNSAPLKIGTSGTCSSSQSFPGLIDELQIYSRALSPSEIADLYFQGGALIPDIAVDPAGIDFGDVEIGESPTQILTISNVGKSDLTITGVDLQAGSSSDFVLTSVPTLPAVLAPSATVDVEVAFEPSVEGIANGVLEITSDDLDSPQTQRPLIGNGTMVPLTPDEQIVAILEFFDAAVLDETLVGEGPGKSAAGRLSALHNMLEAVGDLIANELDADACDQAHDALKRTDGLFPPPDFVSGDAAAELAAQITELRATLGCE